MGFFFTSFIVLIPSAMSDGIHRDRGRKGSFVRTFGRDLTPEERTLFQYVIEGKHEQVEELLKNFQKEDSIWKKRNERNATLVETAILNDDLKMMMILLVAAQGSSRESFSSLCQSTLALTISQRRFDMTELVHSFMNSQHRVAHPTDMSSHDDEKIVITMAPQLKSRPPDESNGQKVSEPTSSQRTISNINDKVNNIRLISATKARDFNAMQKLVREGHTLRIPDRSSYKIADSILWRKKSLDETTEKDSVSKIRHQMDIFEAYASPEYIILKEEDPILAALKRNETFRQFALLYPENKEAFEKLANLSSHFALELMKLCQSEAEVKDILAPPCNCPTDAFHSKFSIISVNFGRLRKLVGLKQMEFVTHPICQKVIYGIWLGQMNTKWPNYSTASSVIHVLIQMLMAPFVCLLFVFDARFSFFSYTLNVPMNRFIYSITSFLVFLVLLSYSSLFRGSNRVYRDAIFWNDWLILLWVVALTYKVGSDILFEKFATFCDKCKFRRRWFHFWSFYDLVMVLIFILSSLCFFIARINLVMEVDKQSSLKLSTIAEGLYSITITVAIIRVLEWFHLSRALGHIIISFSRMTEIIFRLLIIYGIVLFAFSFGLYTVYKDYHQDNHGATDKGETVFMTYSTTLEALFWAIFGQGESDYAVIPDDNQAKSLHTVDQKFSIVIGYFLWGVYHVAFVLILLNMLIAIMTNCFQAIQDNCDMEWKFARTKLWIYYFEDHNAVPPPFNLLRALRNILVHGIRKVFPFKRYSIPVSQPPGNESDKRPDDEQPHEETHELLIQRYMMKRMKMGVKSSEQKEHPSSLLNGDSFR